MHIKFNVDDALPKISVATSLVSSKPALPILETILFEPVINDQSATTLKITTTDNDNRISLDLPVIEVSDDMHPFCVSAKSLSAALRSLAGLELTIEIDYAKKTIKGVYTNGKFTLPYLDAEDFPSAFADAESSEIKTAIVSSGAFSQAISSVAYGVADDALRPVLNGVYVLFSNNEYTLVSTDAQKLIKYSVKSASNIEGNFILQTKPAHILRSLFQKSGEELKVSFNDKRVFFSSSDMQLHSRLIEGKYPNYESIMPIDNNIHFDVDKVVIMSAIKRTMALGNQTSNLVTLDLQMGTLKIESEDINYSTSASEIIETPYAGVPIKIGFKGTNLLLILQNLDCDKVTFKLKEPSRACLITPTDQIESEDCVALIMPMLI